MKILILEDDPQRILGFREAGITLNMTLVTTMKEAIDAYVEGGFTHLFLDHDLGGEVYVCSEHKNTGAEFARWLRDHVTSDHPKVIIHSYNGAGAKVMLEALDDWPSYVVWVPFGNHVLRYLSDLAKEPQL